MDSDAGSDEEDCNIDMFQLQFQGYKMKIPDPIEYHNVENLKKDSDKELGDNKQ